MAAEAGSVVADPGTWIIPMSDTAKRSNNPIRKIVEGLKKPNMPDKPHIPLSLGTIYN
jgi:hypothetical protein